MKKNLISILAFIFIISTVTIVNAATGSISVSSSTDSVIKGKNFTVTIAGTADSPIDGMYTKFTYDKNVLELISATAGENYGNNSSEGEILVTNNSSSTSPTSATLYTMTFKVLDNTNVDSTIISFSDSTLHLNEEGTVKDTATSIGSVTVNIKSDDTTVDNNDKNEQKTNNTSTTANKSTTKSNSSSNKTNKLPQTGVEMVSLIAIVALGAIGVASYISYKKYKNI